MLFEKTKIYGVTGINKQEALTRTDHAVGLKPTSLGQDPDTGYNLDYVEWHSDFDNCYPWCDMKEVTDIYGNVFIKIPKFYAKISTDTDGSLKFQISGCRYEGFSTLFIDGYGNELDYVLVGKYEGSLYKVKTATDYAINDNKVWSVSHARAEVPESGGPVKLYALATDLTIDDFRARAMNWGTGYQQYDFLIDGIIKLLFTIEFATTNSQVVLQGQVDGADPQTDTGSTDFIRTSTGSKREGGCDFSIKYRGIENPWGNVEKWCDGIAFLVNRIYVCTDPRSYSHNADTYESNTGSLAAPYFYVGDRILCNSCYTAEITPFNKLPLLCFTSKYNMSMGSVFNDIYMANTYGNGTALKCSGGYSSGYGGGLWYFNDNGYYAGTASQANNDKKMVNKAGGRLCFKPIDGHEVA